MSVIAWDGKIVAADKRGVCGDYHSINTKLFSFDDIMPVNSPLAGTIGYLGFVGNASHGMALISWFMNDNADPSKYPEFQKGDEWTRLIHIDVVKDKAIAWVYEATPYPVRVEDTFAAWGSGRDYALAAMYLGRTAIEAVELASRFDPNCGNGVTSFKARGQ